MLAPTRTRAYELGRLKQDVYLLALFAEQQLRDGGDPRQLLQYLIKTLPLAADGGEFPSPTFEVAHPTRPERVQIRTDRLGRKRILHWRQTRR